MYFCSPEAKANIVILMRDFHIAVDINAPSKRVWEIMRDVERWPEWTPTVKSVRLDGGGALMLGSRAMIRQPKLAPAKWQVTDLDDRAMSFTWVTRGPGVRVGARE